MLLYVGVLLICATVCLAQSNEEVTPTPWNMITVPSNCPPGQQWVNGACREIWRMQYNPSAADLGIIDPGLANVIMMPANCLEGQVLINGACRDVWTFFRPPSPLSKKNEDNIDPSWRNVITVPPNCPPGQEWINGACRDVWRFSKSTTPIPIFRNLELRDRRQTDDEVEIVETFDQEERNIINIPNQCPKGYRPDALGICRPIMI